MSRGTLVATTRWPEKLVLVRHGQSVGNLADDKARENGAERLDLELRDADVPLSDTGRAQAEAVGRHLAGLDADTAPEVVVSSPYRRAAETAERAGLDACDARVRVDLRLRLRRRHDARREVLLPATLGRELVRRHAAGALAARRPA